MSPMSRRFVAERDRFIARHRLPVVLFRKGQRKDDVMVERLRDFPLKEGVVFVGKAQEKAPVFRTEKRRSPHSGRPYPWIVKSTAMVNHYYIYAVDVAKTKASDQRLNATYNALEAPIDPAQRRPLLAAQRLWVRYQDACR
jgi:hypothetical protein